MTKEEFNRLTKAAGRLTKAEYIRKALEKQEAERPYMESDGDADGYPVWDYYCPNCGRDFEEDQPNYCSNCGQKIDWIKEENKE